MHNNCFITIICAVDQMAMNEEISIFLFCTDLHCHTPGTVSVLAPLCPHVKDKRCKWNSDCA